MSLPPDYAREIQALNREVLAHDPADTLQFCANFFQRRLESQRAEFLLHQQYPGGVGGGVGGGGGKQGTSTTAFPGNNSNPFGSPPRVVDAALAPIGPRAGAGGMKSVREEEEEDGVASPTATGFPNNVMEKNGNGSNNSSSSKENGSGNGNGHGEGGFGNFGGFGGLGRASSSSPPAAPSSGGGGGGGDAQQSFPSNYNMNRRTSVSAESLNPASSANDNWTAPQHAKTAEQQSRLRAAVSANFLFSHLDDEQSATVLGALQEKAIPARGIKVISQGDVGDYFYVVESGRFDIYVSATGKLGPGPDGMGKKVAESGPGSSFGELALMYNAPRAATVVSVQPSMLWSLDRVTFRRILMDSAFQRRRMYEGFLEEVGLLSSLTAYERSKIADALETIKFPAGCTIIREGDAGESFFLLESGEAEAYKRGVEKPVKKYGKGEYFGELALLNDAPRAASVVSRTEVKVAKLGKDGFQRLLGPVEEMMRRNDYGSSGEGVDPLASK